MTKRVQDIIVAKRREEKADLGTLQSSLRTVSQRYDDIVADIARVDNEIERLSIEKEQLEERLDLANEQIAELNDQIWEAENA